MCHALSPAAKKRRILARGSGAEEHQRKAAAVSRDFLDLRRRDTIFSYIMRRRRMRRSTALPLIGLAGMLGGCTVVRPLPQVAAAPAASPSRYCREYTATGMVGGRPQETVGTACLDADGHWRIVPGEGTAEQQAGGAAPPPVVTYPYPYPYPAYSYLYPYPAWYGPRVSLGFGFRFGGHHHHGYHHHH
jgi:hypothetical protein